MNSYWLSRVPGQDAEGPFLIGQLESMFNLGQLTSRAVVCLEGTEDWLPLHEELEHQASLKRQLQPRKAPERSLEEVMRLRDAEQAASYDKVIGWGTMLICLPGFVPMLGMLAFVIWGVWVLPAGVLCILQMVKGRAGRGFWNLMVLLLIAPLAISLFQALSLMMLASAKNP